MLKHFITVSSQKNLDNSFDKFDVLSVSGKYGIVNQIKFQGRSFAGKTLTNYKVVNTNDVVYTKSPIKNNPYGVIKVNKHKSGIVSTLYAVYNPTKYVCSNFVELYFNDNLRLNKYLKPIVNIGAKHDMKIANKEVINHNVIFPEVEEQRQICTFFLKLEKLISLQQRKLQQLKLLKEAMLQDLFTDKKVPHLRFNGFHTEWKRYSLGNIAKIITGGDKDISKIKKHGKYPVIANSTNTNGIIGYYDNDYRVAAPAITVTGRGEIGHAVARFKNFTPVVRLLAISSQQDTIFLTNSINKIRFFNESTGVPQLTQPQLSKYKIIIPDILEQSNIGRLIEKLDNLINLQQEKINKLESLKKFLLQNMFI